MRRRGNLWRVHWFNDASRKARARAGHVVLPPELTGVPAPIVVLFGRRFPMIGAHKVLAAYACSCRGWSPGRFDPSHDRAIWPSTGNYCRGGVAISRILGCRGVAVLPAGMSRERFEWLERWVAEPEDIVRTPGTESNVKEIYDKCAELERDPHNVILNQFSAFANYLIHYACTGAAADHAFNDFKGTSARRLAAFVSATGSAGTIAAGDYLKKRHGTRIAAVEALECPTMLNNGYGEHNIQGIGDKHIPLIHNVMNTDIVVGVSDAAQRRAQSAVRQRMRARLSAGRRKLDPRLVASSTTSAFPGWRTSSPRSSSPSIRIRPERRRHDGRDRQRALYDSERQATRTAYPADSTRSMPARFSAAIWKASPTIT
jgi:cysteine synthase